MIHLVLPVGGSHGWGVCGKYIAKELAALTSDVRLITETFTPDSLGDDLAFATLKKLLPSPEEAMALRSAGGKVEKAFAAMAGTSFKSIDESLRGQFNAGYTFFEDNLLNNQQIDVAKSGFDLIFTGSEWCTQLLKQHGLPNVQTLVQGIDPAIFHPLDLPKPNFRDEFVVFSGGKFEYRKGQDIVLRAFKVLQDRHDDVRLINAWYNLWPYSVATMRMSGLIKFHPRTLDYHPMMRQLLIDNDINPERVISIPARPNAMMAAIYRNADVGIFPNRCEGGTNLVLMEFMACGKPAIVADNFGHRDIASAGNAILIKQSKTISVTRDGTEIAQWEDPDLDETIAHLEDAYQNRDKLKPIGDRAAQDMKQWTWDRTAKQVYDAMQTATA